MKGTKSDGVVEMPEYSVSVIFLKEKVAISEAWNEASLRTVSS